MSVVDHCVTEVAFRLARLVRRLLTKISASSFTAGLILAEAGVDVDRL
jgi:hypothetical protein